METGERVYFARIVPMCDIYDVLTINIRTVKEDWFVGVDSETRQAYPFDTSDIGVSIFSTEKEAKEVVKAAKKKYGMRKLTKISDPDSEE